ncbi:uncharacterized protein BCR38DRAFT_405087 [Pseudomassariella vexata]|uniref:Zn(2)-C6 fungal-type domain-containing protein n=1 Tax=Pseudomassariella vexata TaxID=1141098 RepID=A0A1Y2EKL2_9PEZI|nr:uncharacterized protein BCR38DRAFT_405087 [Pseudomassariella vexata]ORY72079.1 hypothetical protein BCR38DRAFT_405087 [Pseudomassariella vexata]
MAAHLSSKNFLTRFQVHSEANPSILIGSSRLYICCLSLVRTILDTTGRPVLARRSSPQMPNEAPPNWRLYLPFLAIHPMPNLSPTPLQSPGMRGTRNPTETSATARGRDRIFPSLQLSQVVRVHLLESSTRLTLTNRAKSQHSMAPPAKRVRTGCLKCRVRRRKCDESKPRCQRCIAGGFECQYGTRLSFLQKNAFTVEMPESPARESVSSSGYRKVQFVDEVPVISPLQGVPTGGAPTGEPSHQGHAKKPTPSQGDSSVEYNAALGDGASSHAYTETLQHAEVNQGLRPNTPGERQPATPAGGWPPHILGHPSEPARDQIALDVLMSLGNEHAAVFIDRNAQRKPRESIPDNDPSHPEFVNEDGEIRHEEQTTQTLEEPVEKMSTEEEISDEASFALFKHYRYEVAPWLDICDLEQSFGVSVSCGATESKPMYHALLRLAASSLQASPRTNNMSVLVNAARSEQCTKIRPNNAEEALICASLERARQQFSGVETSSECREYLEALDLVNEVHIARISSPLATAADLLLLRIDLGDALIRETPLPRAPRPPEDFTMPWHRSQHACTVLRCAYMPLALCVRAINFCWGEAAYRQGSDGDVISTWTSLVEELNSWYSGRPQEFMSMAEFDDADDGFPSILFTSGAGVFGNQLYHTAMFLLLRHKPRTAAIPRRNRSFTMSPLWHARRICGIALNNDARECWDTSLVASLVVASKVMTHEAQHSAVLSGLDRIGRLTGFDVSTARILLHAEWGI